MATISLRLTDAETALIKKYAELNGISLSDLFRSAVLERIEDEYDLAAYNEAMEEYRKSPVSYSHAEVVRMLEDDSL
ncbi:MAG: ribbon-helix-helix protein, CopG family [Clostridium sp.]|nr:ribbon-helix-helix protein, CopG family [Clostridium sp.]